VPSPPPMDPATASLLLLALAGSLRVIGRLRPRRRLPRLWIASRGHTMHAF
jgi:hypothetical protein